MDYSNIDRTLYWKLMDGDYTRFGDVTGLVGAADDCFAIMGPGEELTLRFPAAAFGPVPEGRQRTFLLKTDSYCKDADLHTAHPYTVGPLPFHGMSAYPYGPHERYPDTEKTRQYRREYNTRQIRSQSNERCFRLDGNRATRLPTRRAIAARRLLRGLAQRPAPCGRPDPKRQPGCRPRRR